MSLLWQCNGWTKIFFSEFAFNLLFVSKVGQKNEFALLFRDCETNKSTVEEIKETGGLGRKVMSIMVMILIMSINLMLMVFAMVMVIFMVMILIVSMVMLAARSCLGIPVRRESAKGGGGDGEVRQS